MKIIYLEADEEVTSIIERLREESAERIAFVVPRGALLLQSAVNLRLLKREASRQKKEVSIVTLDRIGRNLSSQAGFSVYSELKGKEPINEEATQPLETPPPGVRVHRYERPIVVEREAEALPEAVPPPALPGSSRVAPREGSTQPRPPSRAAWAVVLLSLLVLLLFLPSASVAMKLPTEPLTTEVVVKVDAEADSNLDQGILRGRFLEGEESITERIATSGKKNVGGKASGTITVSNRSGSSVAVPSGTRFRTESGLFFRTTAELSVPPASAKVTSGGEAVISPGTTEVGVEAEGAGTEYNLRTQSLAPVNLSGVSSGVIAASVTGELSGGTTEEKPIVSQNDLDQLKIRLTEAIRAALTRRFQDQVGQRELVFAQALELTEESFEVSPQVGAEASELIGTMRARGSTLSVLESEYQELVVRSAKDRVPGKKRLILSSKDEIAPQGVRFDRARKVLEIEGRLTTKVGPDIEAKTLRGALRAQSTAGAEAVVSRLAPDAKTEIRVSPSFLPRLPLFASRIKIVLEYE